MCVYVCHSCTKSCSTVPEDGLSALRWPLDFCYRYCPHTCVWPYSHAQYATWLQSSPLDSTTRHSLASTFKSGLYGLALLCRLCQIGPDRFCSARLDILPQNVAAKSSIFCRARWHKKLDILLHFAPENVYFILFPYNPLQRFIKIAGSVSQHGFPRTCP